MSVTCRDSVRPISQEYATLWGLTGYCGDKLTVPIKKDFIIFFLIRVRFQVRYVLIMERVRLRVFVSS